VKANFKGSVLVIITRLQKPLRGYSCIKVKISSYYKIKIENNEIKVIGTYYREDKDGRRHHHIIDLIKEGEITFSPTIVSYQEATEVDFKSKSLEKFTCRHGILKVNDSYENFFFYACRKKKGKDSSTFRINCHIRPSDTSSSLGTVSECEVPLGELVTQFLFVEKLDPIGEILKVGMRRQKEREKKEKKEKKEKEKKEKEKKEEEGEEEEEEEEEEEDRKKKEELRRKEGELLMMGDDARERELKEKKRRDEEEERRMKEMEGINAADVIEEYRQQVKMSKNRSWIISRFDSFIY